VTAGTQSNWLISGKQAAHQPGPQCLAGDVSSCKGTRLNTQQRTALNTQKQAYNELLTFFMSFYLTTTTKSQFCVKEE